MQQIISSGNDYLIAVKGNQPKLFDTLQQQFVDSPLISQVHQVERSRDRQVERRISVSDGIDSIDPQWVGVKRIVKVERWGTRGKRPFRETQYYISSLSLDAVGFNRLIREHWHVENRLHWVKDVVMKEDTTPVCDGYTIINFAIVRTIALNLFRQNGFDSITQGVRRVAHDIPRLFSFFQ